MLAAVCTGLAVLAGLASVRTAAPTTEPVVVAARDLPSGTDLADADLRVADVPVELVPERAAGRTRDVVGSRLAGPVRRGETLTDARVLGEGTLLGHSPGTVVATVRVADPVEVESVRVGEHVDVVAVVPEGARGQPRGTIVARDVEVVAVDAVTDDDPGASAVVRVAAEREVAVALAEAAVDARLGVLTTPGT